MRIALQMDALSRLSPKFDSTLALAAAAARRGYQLFHYEPQQLRMELSGRTPRITALGHPLKFKAGAQDPWSLGPEKVVNLTDFDVILMRQDPPFDLAYITATHILEHLTDKVRVVNDPVGVRNAPEKLLITHFSHLMPATLIARDICAIEAFRKKHGDIIIKPLHGFAGHGIFHLKPGDDNLRALIESLAERTNEPWMIQKCLPVARLGDKRIILLDGEPVGVFNRFPIKGDIRGNMRVGGKPQAAKLTKRDKAICKELAPALRACGLFFVGLDVIGDYVTEINVTSPTGIVVADQLAGHKGKDTIAEQFWDRLLKS